MVMLPSKLNIEEQMQKIDTDLGYDWNTRDQRTVPVSESTGGLLLHS